MADEPTAEDDEIAADVLDDDEGEKEDSGGPRFDGWNNPEYRVPYVVTTILLAGGGYLLFDLLGLFAGMLVGQLGWMVLDWTT